MMRDETDNSGVVAVTLLGLFASGSVCALVGIGGAAPGEPTQVPGLFYDRTYMVNMLSLWSTIGAVVTLLVTLLFNIRSFFPPAICWAPVLIVPLVAFAPVNDHMPYMSGPGGVVVSVEDAGTSWDAEQRSQVQVVALEGKGESRFTFTVPSSSPIAVGDTLERITCESALQADGTYVCEIR